MIKSKIFIGFTIVELLILSAFYGYSLYIKQGIWSQELPAKQNLVRQLGITDFAIWTEARYTRHPSQTDFFSPFQDLPSALDHFPAGSIISPTFNQDRGL